MNSHQSISFNFGQEYVKVIRDYKNTEKKLARNWNHLRFNLHCIHHEVKQVTLRLYTNVQGASADKIDH